MPVSTRQIGPCFAAEVEGVDMTKPLSPEDVAAIHAGMDRYAVLVFHDQQIDDAQQLAFTRSLGEIEHAIGTSLRAPDELRLPTTFADVSNLDKHERTFARDDRRRLFGHRQPPLALRQLVQGDPGEVLAPARAAASRPRAAIPSSPTCARRTTRSTTRRGPRSRA